MKKTLLNFLAFAFIAIAFIGCTAGGGDPKAVAKNFFEALKTMNIEEAEKYATKDSKTVLDLMKTMMSMAPKNLDSMKAEMANHKMVYSDPVINGDEATLSVTIDGKDKTDFKLKKEDGLWKVAFDKNSLMKTGMEKMEQQGASESDMKEAEKALEQMNSDSVGQAIQGAGNAIEEAGKTIDSASKH